MTGGARSGCRYNPRDIEELSDLPQNGPFPSRRRYRRRRHHAHRQRPPDVLAQSRRRRQRRRARSRRSMPARFDVRIAAEVKDFDPTTVMDRKMARRMSRFVHLAMAAGKEAVADAGLDFAEWSPERRDRVAVAVNTGGGGIEQVTINHDILVAKGPGSVSPFAFPALSASMAACQLSMEYGLTGPVITQSAACATSDHLLPRRAADDPARRGRCRARRRHRGATAADGLRSAGQHARPLATQRRADPRLAAVRSRP